VSCEQRNAFGYLPTYRGWTIGQDPTDEYYATGPNYDASYEGPEDGWVDNGEKVSAPTYDELVEEIDSYFEEHGL
jgi:hypothetical protein